jgi:hypothetical protein
MEPLGVDVVFGMLERGDPALFEAVWADAEARRYIKGVGAQWAGRWADGATVVVIQNDLSQAAPVRIAVDGRVVTAALPPDSSNTRVI